MEASPDTVEAAEAAREARVLALRSPSPQRRRLTRLLRGESTAESVIGWLLQRGDGGAPDAEAEAFVVELLNFVRDQSAVVTARSPAKDGAAPAKTSSPRGRVRSVSHSSPECPAASGFSLASPVASPVRTLESSFCATAAGAKEGAEPAASYDSDFPVLGGGPAPRAAKAKKPGKRMTPTLVQPGQAQRAPEATMMTTTCRCPPRFARPRAFSPMPSKFEFGSSSTTTFGFL